MLTICLDKEFFLQVLIVISIHSIIYSSIISVMSVLYIISLLSYRRIVTSYHKQTEAMNINDRMLSSNRIYNCKQADTTVDNQWVPLSPNKTIQYKTSTMIQQQNKATGSMMNDDMVRRWRIALKLNCETFVS